MSRQAAGETAVHEGQRGDAGHHHDVRVTVRLLPNGAEAAFELASNASLLEVLELGAKHLKVQLLPPAPEKPLDELHDLLQHGGVGPAIGDLGQALGSYLEQQGTTAHFGIKLVLAFRVNTRWAVAPKPDLTPREILALPGIDLNYQEYTLYYPGSNKELPLDTPIHLSRGEALEAQRDGKYGGAVACVRRRSKPRSPRWWRAASRLRRWWPITNATRWRRG